MQIHQLIYQSSATVDLTPAQLQQVLPLWRTHNQAADISGLLLYGEQGIMQVLEGEAHQVHALYQHIARDVRHFNVHAVADGPVPQRAFGQWSMGFALLDVPGLSQLAGYASPARAASLLPDQPQRWPELLALLQEFVLREQSPY